jgi:small subunit ribosomal protein S9
LGKNLAIGTGRRKTSIARVFLRDGEGKVTINGRSPENYFPFALQASSIMLPLEVTSNLNKFDVMITVRGGGVSGQAGACKLGIANALLDFDESNRTSLRANGFLTRDNRMVERKKYGRRGARRRFQFSKR